MIGRSFLARLPALLRAALLDGAEAVAARARATAPVASGALVRSISAHADGEAVLVRAGVPQAVVVELGSHRRVPHPFLRPALLDEREAITARVRAALREMPDA